MPRKTPATRRKSDPAVESPQELSRAAELTGITLTEQNAAWVANKVAQRRAAIEVVKKLPYQGHEPANSLSLARYE